MRNIKEKEPGLWGRVRSILNTRSDIPTRYRRRNRRRGKWRRRKTKKTKRKKRMTRTRTRTRRTVLRNRYGSNPHLN